MTFIQSLNNKNFKSMLCVFTFVVVLKANYSTMFINLWVIGKNRSLLFLLLKFMIRIYKLNSYSEDGFPASNNIKAMAEIFRSILECGWRYSNKWISHTNLTRVILTLFIIWIDWMTQWTLLIFFNLFISIYFNKRWIYIVEKTTFLARKCYFPTESPSLMRKYHQWWTIPISWRK